MALTALLGVGVSACDSTPSEGALAGKSATSILSTSLQAYYRQSSVHFATTNVSGKTKTVEAGATSRTAASETQQSGGATVLSAIVARGTAYIRAPAAVLEGTLQISPAAAAANAGKWISLQRGDTGYDQVSKALSPSAAIVSFVPAAGLRVRGIAQFGGQTTVAVEGSASSSAPATATVYVSTAAPYLPVGATLEGAGTGSITTYRSAAVFGKWNQPVNPILPKDPVPASSLT